MTGTLLQDVAGVGVRLSFSPDFCHRLTWVAEFVSESHPHSAFEVLPVRGWRQTAGRTVAGIVVRTYRVLLGTRHLWVLSIACGTSRHPILPYLGSKLSAKVNTVLCILLGACPGNSRAHSGENLGIALGS